MNANGFALLAALWLIAFVGGTVGVATATSRLGQRTTANRNLLVRGKWAAEACLAIFEARWVSGQFTDTATIDLGRTTTCRWRSEDPSTKLNVNRAGQATLYRMLDRIGSHPDSTRRLVDGILSRRRIRDFTDVESLHDVPGWDPRLLAYVTVEGTGTINASAASPIVLASLPGMTAESVQHVVRRRESARRIVSLDELMGITSPESRELLLANYGVLTTTLQFSRTMLIVTATGWVGSFGPNPHSTIELVVNARAARLAVVRRRVGWS